MLKVEIWDLPIAWLLQDRVLNNSKLQSFPTIVVARLNLSKLTSPLRLFLMSCSYDSFSKGLTLVIIM